MAGIDPLWMLNHLHFIDNGGIGLLISSDAIRRVEIQRHPEPSVVEAVHEPLRIGEKCPVPGVPRFALGNWWSRYHKYTEESYLTLMEAFRTRDIPLSVAVIAMPSCFRGSIHWLSATSAVPLSSSTV